MATLNIERLKCNERLPTGGTDSIYFFLSIDGGDKIRFPEKEDTYWEADYDTYYSVNKDYTFSKTLEIDVFKHNSIIGEEDFGKYIFNADSLNPKTDPGAVKVEGGPKNTNYEIDYVIVTGEIPVCQILYVKCILTASSTDSGVISAVTGVAVNAVQAAAKSLADSPDPRLAAVAAGLDVGAAIIQGIPAVIDAIASSTEYPDQLYLSLESDKNPVNRIYPSVATYEPIYDGTRLDLVGNNVTFNLARGQNLYAMEYDKGDDDRLATFNIVKDEPGYYFAVGTSSIEGSVYMIGYEIH